MIAPDTRQVDIALSRAAAVGEAVSFHAGVIGHIVPVLLSSVRDHDLTEQQSTTLQRAIHTGQDWVAQVCDCLAQDFPPLVSGFHRQFLRQVDAIHTLRADIAKASAGATQHHRRRAINLFEGLSSLVADMENRMRRGNRKMIRLIAAAALDRAALESLPCDQSGPALTLDDCVIRQIGFCKVPIALRPEVEQALDLTSASKVYALALSVAASAGLGAEKTVAEMGQLPGIWGYATGLLRAHLEDLTEGPTRDVGRIIDLAQLDEACAAWAAMVAAIEDRCQQQPSDDHPAPGSLRLVALNGRPLP
ncbi:hypothetical protein EU803_01130 [Loktanella sp. IMCC34160]|uniref:hypothetical protein n=1 Tax=Loktanella sp. IMCC34160 TaxID=2510646 RepID=UPI00101E07F3|nr:hypothetical protein [Loktanella sp. IMCC34160]RYG92739.1 hypothetical protein EU803_01130 [Loktanella sp. IMCC34160]